VPTPAPTTAPGSTAGQISDLTGVDESFAEQVVTEMTSNPLTTFVTLLAKELDKTDDAPPKRDHRPTQDIPIDDNQCR
jgi:hypothetical protein